MSTIKIPAAIVVAWMALALMFSGCAGPWTSVPHTINTAFWSIRPPAGWMDLRTGESDMLSKDGPFLEYILIQSRSLKEGFRFTKQKISPHMLPVEVAELITDSMRADPLIRRFRLLCSEPAMLGGFSGFKLTYSYLDQNGVDIKAVYYGAVVGKKFFNLRYTATRRYYFDSQLAAFKRVVDSLRFVQASNPAS
jgi:hypothetical protein